MRNQPHLRQQMGDMGRKHIKKHYSLQQNVPLLAEILQNVAQDR